MKNNLYILNYNFLIIEDKCPFVKKTMLLCRFLMNIFSIKNKKTEKRNCNYF